MRSRLLFGLLLLFGSEILVWTNPPGRALTDWLLIIPAYLALSAVLLDFTVRYRVRDLFGLLVFTGLYGLIAALVINPASTLIDMPRTLFTRIMGAHALLGTEMFALFLALTGGRRRLRGLLAGCVVLGFTWGIWVKGWPIDEGYGAVEMTTMLLYGSGMLGVIGGVLYMGGKADTQLRVPTHDRDSVGTPFLASDLETPSQPHPQAGEEYTHVDSLPVYGEGRGGVNDLRLSRRTWLIVAIILIGLLALRLAQGLIDTGWLAVIAMLTVLGWAMLWFRGRAQGETLLDGHIPINPLPFSAFIRSGILFLLLAVGGYNLPPLQLDTLTPLSLIGLAFTAYGLTWLPTVSVYLGFRHYLRQIEARRL